MRRSNPYAHARNTNVLNELRGDSFPMKRLRMEVERLAPTGIPTLITGESGVGKELVGRALHELSRRAGPFVPVNCGAIPHALLASELFGHVRGAFTGATTTREGLFRRAHGGTLFLDEVGELPLEAQPALLRALETSEVQPLGQNKSVRVHVRVISATNRALENAVKTGTFREDLYYRLAVGRIHIPPLRERAEDIPTLATSFAEEAGCRSLPAEILDDLLQRPWPGNVRELRNAVLTYLAVGDLPGVSSIATGAAAPIPFDVGRPYLEQKRRVVERFTRDYLAALLEHTRQNQTAAAHVSGLTRTHLGRLVARYGLSPR